MSNEMKEKAVLEFKILMEKQIDLKLNYKD